MTLHLTLSAHQSQICDGLGNLHIPQCKRYKCCYIRHCGDFLRRYGIKSGQWGL